MTETVETMTPVEMTKVGQRHIAVGEYSTAVEVLAKACELLAKEHGDTADECADAYFWYGKALLSLSREERGILGGVMSNTAENASEDAKGEEEKDAKSSDDGEAEKGAVEEKEEMEVESSSKEGGNDAEEKEGENDAEEKEGEENKEGEDDKEDEEQPANEDEEVGSEDEAEDDVDNLQLAWEMLELSRSILKRRVDDKSGGKAEESLLAEVYLCLGEVALESETYDKAVVDMQSCLEIQKNLYESNDRRIAETHYQIGLANSLSSNFDDAITHFENAVNILETCIKKLQETTPMTDVAEREIKQLEELIPEIKEKVQDMIECKTETVNLMKEKMCSTNGFGASSCTNGAGPSTSSNGAGPSSSTNGTFISSSSDKKASDISHLVKRKRKASENAEEATVPKKANA